MKSSIRETEKEKPELLFFEKTNDIDSWCDTESIQINNDTNLKILQLYSSYFKNCERIH